MVERYAVAADRGWPWPVESARRRSHADFIGNQLIRRGLRRRRDDPGRGPRPAGRSRRPWRPARRRARCCDRRGGVRRQHRVTTPSRCSRRRCRSADRGRGRSADRRRRNGRRHLGRFGQRHADIARSRPRTACATTRAIGGAPTAIATTFLRTRPVTCFWSPIRLERCAFCRRTGRSACEPLPTGAAPGAIDIGDRNPADPVTVSTDGGLGPPDRRATVA